FYTYQFLSNPGRQGFVLQLMLQKTRYVLDASDGVAYIRKNAQKIPINTEDGRRRLELDKGLSTFEDETVNIPLDSVTNSITTLEFMLGTVPSSEPEPWLRSQFLIVGDKPTVAGTLLFADEPQAALPKRSAIKIYRYGTVEEGPSRDVLMFQPLTIEGPIYDVIKEAVAQTKQIVEGITRIGETGLETISYPDETLHEIITNAVLHRDYSHQTDCQIRVYDDRVEVESPGKLPGHVSATNILDEQLARNPKLVRLINKFPDPPNKDVGEGLNTAFEAMRKIRLREPEIAEKENAVVVFIKHERLSTPSQIVMEYLQANATITNQIGREITGLKRDVQMKDVFVALRRGGLLEQVPGRRGRASAWRKVEGATTAQTQTEVNAVATEAPGEAE
ncbi:ATP-dependent DNA helicase RecG, partial [Methylobacterium organophilum]|nr:ATP-dependent DNA helicase RecG [Methylobacterium organophilum]